MKKKKSLKVTKAWGAKVTQIQVGIHIILSFMYLGLFKILKLEVLNCLWKINHRISGNFKSLMIIMHKYFIELILVMEGMICDLVFTSLVIKLLKNCVLHEGRDRKSKSSLI